MNDDLEGYLGLLITDAINFDKEQRAPERLRALEYLRGVMIDTPSEHGRSSMTTSEVSDAISWIMPGLMRIFAGAAGVVTYEPAKPQDQAAADSATEYVQMIFENECDGYKVLYNWFYDALSTRNGVVKYWWEDEEEGPEQTYEGLAPEQVALVTQDPDVTLTGAMQHEDGSLTVRAKTVERHGRIRVEAIPPEEFLINRAARCLDDAAIVGHRTLKTRSELIEMGYPQGEIEGIPTSGLFDDTDTQTSRTGFSRDAEKTPVQRAMEFLEYYEVYIRFDQNGDGIAERLRVCAAGPANAPVILDSEEWNDEPPFADLTPEFVPHSWQGRSIADETMDIQRVKTVLLRQTLDNLYLVNRQQRAVNASMIENPDEVLNPTIGGVVRVKGNPNDAIMPLTTPFVGEASLAAMSYMDNLLQRRTGVGQSAMTMDGDALVPQTATATQAQHDASYSKVEMIARNFAETGVKRLFRGILKLLVANQNRPRQMKVKTDWPTFDPSQWNPNMDVRVNVGLGTGTRERDLMMLRAVGMEQDKVVAQLGPMNPLVPVSLWRNTRAKMVAASGLRDADQYFADVSDEQFAQWRQQNAPPPQQDPKIVAAQMKANTDVYKIQTSNQLDAAEMQGKFQLKQQEMETEAQLSAVQIAAGGHNGGLTNIRGSGL